MKVKLAKTAGFCFGVRRAVDTVYRELEHCGGERIYTFGPIIHNEEVIKDIQARGAAVLRTEEELDALTGGTVIIRSHGVEKRIYDKLEAKNISIVDATCPYVKKIHNIVREESEKGNFVIIIGDPNHPEVKGIRGWAGENAAIIQNAEEIEENSIIIEKFFSKQEISSKNPEKKACVVAQTTFNYNKFQDLVEIISEKSYDIIVLNTICNATKERQMEARRIAEEVDAMIVIGDKHSSNTQKLFEICAKACKDTYYIQTLDDLNLNQLGSVETVGITAGASTPNKIIEEVQVMSELSFEQMLDESFKTIHNGEVVEGTVIDVKPDEIILNIGYKADGIITKNEYSNDSSLDLTTVVSVGDAMTVKVLKVNDGEGQVLLTYKRLAAEKSNERLKEAFENKEVLKATVTQILGGGLCAEVEGVRVFIPASLVSDSYEKDLSKYDGKEIEFVISEFNPRRNRVIGDRRQLLVAERAEKQRELFARLQVGDTIEGVVKNVTDFGAFVDLGGVDGLLHISEMSWGRVENPKKVFKVGDNLKVLVKDINDTKVALSLKFPETNPWAHASEDFAVGSVITGRVARMTDFGAFVELAPGVDALLHVSQISRAHVDKPSDVLSIGQEIQAKIVDLNEAEKKISLSMKAIEMSEMADAE